MAVGRCLCTFGARLGVFGHMPGVAGTEQGSAGSRAQAAVMRCVSSHPGGGLQAAPQCPPLLMATHPCCSSGCSLYPCHQWDLNAVL